MSGLFRVFSFIRGDSRSPLLFLTRMVANGREFSRIRAGGVYVLAALLLFATTAPAQDAIWLKSGESISCRIDSLTDKIVNVTLPGAGGGSARRTFPAEQVERIEFGFHAGEAEVFARRGSATAAELKPWWDLHFPHLHRPRSRTAAYGLAYGAALLREGTAQGPDKALSIFDLVLARAWSAEDAAAARRGSVHALMAKGDLENAALEAKAVADQSGDATLLVEVGHRLALADFAALRVLEEENPRWEEDDEVAPRRHELFHRALDRFLHPSLFHPTLEEAAARGLLSAAELYLFAGESAEAKARWEDLAKLYPASSFAAEAAKRLQSLSHPPADDP